MRGPAMCASSRTSVERSLYRAPNPGEPLDHIILDPFASPWRPLPPHPDASPHPTPAPLAGQGGTRVAGGWGLPFLERVKQFESTLLREALAAHGNNQRRTAQALGLGYHQFRHYLRKHKALSPRSGG